MNRLVRAPDQLASPARRAWCLLLRMAWTYPRVVSSTRCVWGPFIANPISDSHPWKESTAVIDPEMAMARCLPERPEKWRHRILVELPPPNWPP